MASERFNHDKSGGGNNIYISDYICKIMKFLIETSLFGLKVVFSVRLLEFQLEQTVLHKFLTFSFIHTRMNS